MTTNKLIARFEREYVAYHGISPARAREQERLLVQFSERLDGTLSEMTPSDLQGFAGDLVAQGYHVNTVRKKLNQIRPFITWAHQAGIFDADAYLKLRNIGNPRGATGISKPKPYTRIEIRQLWAQIDEALPKLPEKGRKSQALTRWRNGKGPWCKVRIHAMRLQVDCMIRLALDLGMRRHEIFGLSLDDLHYDNEYLVIQGKANPNTGEPKIRQVAVSEHAREAIKDWIEFRAWIDPPHDSPWLSLWYAETHTNPMQWRRFQTLLQHAVGEQWTWHRLRHTCATERLRNGMPLEQVSQLLGHATLQQTLMYAEVGREDIAKSLESQAQSFGEAVGRAA
jgi:site-specific recombinase XerD